MRSFISIALALLILAAKPVSAGEPAVPDETRAAVMAVLDRFMETFNAQDVDAHLETYHFPHVRLASGTVRVTPDAAAYPRDVYERVLIPSGWAYSEWVSRDIVQAGADKVHVATVFRRLRADGTPINDFPSLYIVERIDGRWAIRARSSFAP